MNLLFSFLITTYLTTFVTAKPFNPTVNTDAASLPRSQPSRPDYSQFVTGLVPNGVNCATANEPLHSIDSYTIAVYAFAGLQDVSSEINALWGLFPFIPDHQLSSTDHPVQWAQGCDPTSTLYHYPLVHDHSCATYLTSGTTPRTGCTGANTTDVVVFSINDEDPTWELAVYCAVLTNSDASNVNRSQRKGYRQCMNN